MNDKEKLDPASAHPAFLKPAGPNLGVAPPRGEAALRRGMFSSLAHTPFRRYWIGLFLSNIGTWMQVVAQGWLVLRLSDSALVLGLVGFAGSIPTFLLAPLAGVAADRANRRKLLIATQSLQMACAFFLAAAVGFHFARAALVARSPSSTAVANAFTMPSHQSLFLDLVGREDLMNAISLNSMQFNLSRVIGPMFAGFAIAAFGEAGCFLLNGISYLAVIAALAVLPSLRRRRGASRGAWVDVRIGMRFARRHPLILPLLAIAASLAIFGTPAVTLAPLFARRLLHVGPPGLGGMLSAVGLGAAGSALVLASLGDFRRKGSAVSSRRSVRALARGTRLRALSPVARFSRSSERRVLLGVLINTLLRRALRTLREGSSPLCARLAGLVRRQLQAARRGAVRAAAALFVGAAGIVLTLLAVRVVKPVPGVAS